ncbi:hypothetical protein HDU67_009144, partial [Dinochytrium kinnereticum]
MRNILLDVAVESDAPLEEEVGRHDGMKCSSSRRRKRASLGGLRGDGGDPGERISSVTTLIGCEDDDEEEEDGDDEGILLPTGGAVGGAAARPLFISIPPPQPSDKAIAAAHAALPNGWVSSSSSVMTVCDDDLDMSSASAMILSPRGNRTPTAHAAFPFPDVHATQTSHRQRQQRRPSVPTVKPHQQQRSSASYSSFVGSLMSYSFNMATYSLSTAVSLIPSSAVRNTVQGIIATAAATLASPSSPAPPPQPTTSLSRHATCVVSSPTAVSPTHPCFSPLLPSPVTGSSAARGEGDFLEALRSTLKER